MAGNIRAISECFIKPNEIVEESKKPYHLGANELMQMSQCHLQIGLLFPNKLPVEADGTSSSSSMDAFLEKLKQSLSSTLVHFYPLAGQFATEVDEEKHESYIYIDCNKGPGAKFIHAALGEVTINDITSPPYVPTTLVQSFFQLGKIPTNYDGHSEPLLVVQVTELADGLFFGVSINHSVVDGASFWHFFSSWSELFRSNNATLSKPPIHSRWFLEECGPIIKIPHVHPDEFIKRYKQNDENEPPLREVILHFARESIEMLKAKANKECGGTANISSFQALSALIWRSIIRSRDTEIDESSTSMCMFVFNGRSRVKPPQPQEYFGSLIDVAFNPVKVSELLDMSLGSAALILNKSVENFDDQCINDRIIRWIKAPAFYPTPGAELKFILISGSHREKPYDIEFGLGKAVALRTGSNKYNGKVVFRPARQGKGSVDIEVCLSPDTMTTFQQDKELLSFLN